MSVRDLARRAGEGVRPRDLVIGAVALLVDALSGFVAVVGSDGQSLGGPAALRVALAVPLALPLVWRRKRPVAVLLAVAAVQTAGAAAGVVVSAVSASLVIALLTVCIHSSVWRGLTAVVGVTAVLSVVDRVMGPGELWVAWVVIVPVVVLLGWAIARSRDDVVRATLRTTLAGQSELIAARVSDERTRIARELHDVVSHALSALTIQAAVARGAVRTDPDAAEQALAAIEDQARRALAEMRLMLGLLRGPTPVDTVPTPGLASIDELAAGVRATGLRVEVDVDVPHAPAVPDSVSLAAYRIVQEGLTNALRHAGAGTVRVTVRRTAGSLCVEIVDDGRGATSPSPGSAAGTGLGLVGLGERVAVLGGTLDAGPAPAGGWRLSADLPLVPGATLTAMRS